MIEHSSVTPIQLKKLIRTGKLTLAGNQRLKIYGRLQCSSGKRMKKKNRVFFGNEEEAIRDGFRPCGHCMNEKHLNWKTRNSNGFSICC